MLVPYSCCTKQFEDHYAGQIGSGIPYYSGMKFQKGYGLGGFFRRLFRSAVPFLKKGAKTVGEEVLRSGARVASDVLGGKDFKTAASERSKESGKSLANRALNKLHNMIGKGSYKRKRKTSKVSRTPKPKKRRGGDIFDS